jgi:hypothetical protein
MNRVFEVKERDEHGGFGILGKKGFMLWVYPEECREVYDAGEGDQQGATR